MFFRDRFEDTSNRLACRRVRVVGQMDSSVTHSHYQILHRLVGCEIADDGFGPAFLRPKLNNRFAHRHSSPIRARPVDLVLAPLGLGAAGYVADGMLDRAL